MTRAHGAIREFGYSERKHLQQALKAASPAQRKALQEAAGQR